ncbi:MAG: DUF819 family protein [Bacteroidetes bacterium]|nr:DUF819 family protein [Bacteroidota bacterium]HET6243362.1 DUF819 family protein [Bacteroidia bacterium]
MEPLFTNDAVVLGILLLILALVFQTSSSSHPWLKKFYKYVPALLLCYFIPALLNSFNIISGEESQLYKIASRYLLPASLVLLCVSIDMKAILQLGPKAIIMFLAGTLGIIVGGPVAILITSIFSPETVGGIGPDAVWRGMATIAGSWIGGGANQTAMKEVFGTSDQLFSVMIAVDVIVANVWMAVLLFGVGMSDKLDKVLKADNSAIVTLQKKIEHYRAEIGKIPSLADTITILAVGFGATAVSHFGADYITPLMVNHPQAEILERFSLTSSFFWLIVIATTLGLLFSFTPAKRLEGAGASRIGSVLLYILVATIGMKMDIMAIGSNPGLFVVGLIWMLVHVTVLLTVAKIIKAPYFFVAVGSQANVGGAASAPIVASAFNPSLAPVGVLLAVFGYALGTYGAWICAQLMRIAAE